MPGTVELTVGEHVYQQEYLPTKTALDVHVQLAKTVGPGCKGVIEAFLEGSMSEAEQGAAIAYGITEVLPTLDADALWGLAKTFAGVSKWRNKTGDYVPLAAIFDKHFEGPKGLARLCKFVWASLKEQIAPFLGELGLSAIMAEVR